MSVTHKRVIRIPKAIYDIPVIQDMLSDAAKYHKREAWYDDSRELYSFTGSSLDNLKDFADKIHRTLELINQYKIGFEGMEKTTELHKIANMKIRDACKLTYEDRVKKMSNEPYKSYNINISNDDYATHESKIDTLKLPYKIERMQYDKQKSLLYVQGRYPYVENFERALADMMARNGEED